MEEAKARYKRAQYEVEDSARRIELEVRTAYSNFCEAEEVLESQKKVVEHAEEALRLANARAEAGTGTQLDVLGDVLGAQTALTEIGALSHPALQRSRMRSAAELPVRLRLSAGAFRTVRSRQSHQTVKLRVQVLAVVVSIQIDSPTLGVGTDGIHTPPE